MNKAAEFNLEKKLSSLIYTTLNLNNTVILNASVKNQTHQTK